MQLTTGYLFSHLLPTQPPISLLSHSSPYLAIHLPIHPLVFLFSYPSPCLAMYHYCCLKELPSPAKNSFCCKDTLLNMQTLISFKNTVTKSQEELRNVNTTKKPLRIVVLSTWRSGSSFLGKSFQSLFQEDDGFSVEGSLKEYEDRGQCILFSVVFNPPRPSHHIKFLPPSYHLSTLS